MQNNVTRFLVSQKVKFTVLESEAIKRSAVESAELFHLDPNTVYKTIVGLRLQPGKPLLLIIPGPLEVDIKKTAAVIGEKKIRVATQKEAEDLTKLQTGGISALALLNHGFQTLVHNTMLSQDEISVSGGQRGLSILMNAKDFLRITRAMTADIASQP